MPENVFGSKLRTGIIPESLLENPNRVIIQHYFDNIVQRAEKADTRLVTPGPAVGVTLGGLQLLPTLVKQAITDRETSGGIVESARVNFTEEEPDKLAETEVITFSVLQRGPGAYSQGRPMEGDVKNLRPILREVVEDPDNPGYRLAKFGYLYDCRVRFTCWAKTNKTANIRAFWFEKLMLDYDWFYTYKGLN